MHDAHRAPGRRGGPQHVQSVGVADVGAALAVHLEADQRGHAEVDERLESPPSESRELLDHLQQLAGRTRLTEFRPLLHDPVAPGGDLRTRHRPRECLDRRRGLLLHPRYPQFLGALPHLRHLKIWLHGPDDVRAVALLVLRTVEHLEVVLGNGALAVPRRINFVFFFPSLRIFTLQNALPSSIAAMKGHALVITLLRNIFASSEQLEAIHCEAALGTYARADLPRDLVSKMETFAAVGWNTVATMASVGAAFSPRTLHVMLDPRDGDPNFGPDAGMEEAWSAYLYPTHHGLGGRDGAAVAAAMRKFGLPDFPDGR
ncbi:hypothetical protein DFJ74DRAFT_759524 [Hyaloraphidium curvatum]|nr:hypothetical protein DFJ74DRAFT_759524 [Hyaloraphidium curvatum]